MVWKANIYGRVCNLNLPTSFLSKNFPRNLIAMICNRAPTENGEDCVELSQLQTSLTQSQHVIKLKQNIDSILVGHISFIL